ncbi:MAG: hypothetical protein WC610_02320 [Patescibacteria group bacterium]
MRKASILLILILGLFLAGCAKQNNQNQTAPLASANLNKEDSSQKAVPSAELKRFYPQTAAVNKPAAAPNPAKDFVITQDLTLKLYLVDKYNPGTCYGLPGPVPDVAVKGLVSNNPELAQFVKYKYKLNSDLDIYNKIKQLNGISLSKIAGGKYQFNFTNGQCCVLTAYEGEAVIINQTISDSITRQETKNNPC